MVGIPLLFLMRHTLELGYKFSLFNLCELNGTSFTPEAPGGEVKWTPSFGQENAEIKLGSQILED
jgi:hypothetical protein